MIEYEIKDLLRYNKAVAYNSSMISHLLNINKRSITDRINKYVNKKKIPRIYRTKKKFRIKGRVIPYTFYHMGQRKNITSWIFMKKQLLEGYQ